MSLPVPVVGVASGPDWANLLDACLAIIDAHNHAPGSGVQISPPGININEDLTFNSNAATSLAFTGFVAQGSGIETPITRSLYSSGVDLYYQDGNGTDIRITSGGAVNATSSGISSGTATASFVSNILVVDQSPGVGAAIDAASYILRYNGSYPSPSGNAIVLAAPASLAGEYQITFPATPPAASGAFLTESTAGVLSYTNVDNSTLQISSNTLEVAPQGITAAQIANQTITATQIAINTVVPRSYSSPTGTSGSVVYSASSGAFTTTSTSPVAVTNLSVTLATTGNPVFVGLIQDNTYSGTGGVSAISYSDNASSVVYIKTDGGGPVAVGLSTSNSGAFSEVTVPPGSVNAIVFANAGTHTFSIEAASVLSGTTTAVYYCVLVAYEL